jgi:hypothetical protein
MKRATLYEVKEDGEVLVLTDGRRLYTPNVDISCTWTPATDLEIEKQKTDLSTLSFPLIVHNLETGEKVEASPDSFWKTLVKIREGKYEKPG